MYSVQCTLYTVHGTVRQLKACGTVATVKAVRYVSTEKNYHDLVQRRTIQSVPCAVYTVKCTIYSSVVVNVEETLQSVQ